MNILFVHEVDWLSKVVFDIHSLSESLSLRGHRVYAIDYENKWKRNGLFSPGCLRTRKFNGVSRAFPGASVDLIRPGFIRIPVLSRLSAGITHYREIKRAIRDKKIDAVVLYSVPTNGLQAVRAAGKSGIPVIFRSIDILNQMVPVPALRLLTRSLERRVYSRADMLLTLTPKLSKYVIALGAKPDRVRLLPMPVDTSLFHPMDDPVELRDKWGIGRNEPVVLFVGTLFDFSGLDLFIPVFPRVMEHVPGAKLLIVGDGPQRPRLEGIIARHGLQASVIITGFQPYQTMPQYMNMAAVCINTFLTVEATRDIFPGKTVQFLACGKALVATPLPGMLAMIPGEEKGVVYADNGGRMADEVISLLRSEERRRGVEAAGLSYVRQVHTHDRIAHQLEAILEEAVKGETNAAIPGRV